MKLVVILLALVMRFGGGCRSKGREAAAKITRADLIGEWRNFSVKLEMPSYQGGASTFRLDANEDNWEEIMEMKPIRTYFQGNGTYVSEYRNLQDSVFMVHSGSWETSNDSLILRQHEPVSFEYRYAVSMQGDTATFIAVMDFDGDGQQDDHYLGRQTKFE